MGFEQATIKVEREREFGELKSAVEETFSTLKVEGFLKALERASVRVRDWDGVLAKGLLEQSADRLAKQRARDLYGQLTLSDQAQMREFYLSKIEEVRPELRAKFHKLYQYY